MEETRRKQGVLRSRNKHCEKKTPSLLPPLLSTLYFFSDWLDFSLFFCVCVCKETKEGVKGKGRLLSRLLPLLRRYFTVTQCHCQTTRSWKGGRLKLKFLSPLVIRLPVSLMTLDICFFLSLLPPPFRRKQNDKWNQCTLQFISFFRFKRIRTGEAAEAAAAAATEQNDYRTVYAVSETESEDEDEETGKEEVTISPKRNRPRSPSASGSSAARLSSSSGISSSQVNLIKLMRCFTFN